MNSTGEGEYALMLQTYIPPFLIVLGTISNILTIIAVNGPNSKKISFTVYITALAVVDILVLYSLALGVWLNRALKIKVNLSARLMCKLYHFAVIFLPQMSSWLVMCLTIERAICVNMKKMIGTIPGVRVGVIVVGSMACFLVAVNSHILYGRDFIETPNGTVCDFVDNSYGSFYFNYWGKVHFCLYFMLPASVILIGNTITVTRMVRNNRLLTSTSSNLLKRKTRQVFLITLLISIAFLVLVTPLPLLNFFTRVNFDKILETVFLLMLYLNHAINFFLYVLSGSRFRKDLWVSFQRFCCIVTSSSESP